MSLAPPFDGEISSAEPEEIDSTAELINQELPSENQKSDDRGDLL